jgi:PIN domain nuclease of toxin-antitoxin system
MTLLDTHIWIWWALGDPKLGARLGWLDAEPVATANRLACDLLTADRQILSYAHAKAIAS